MKHIELLILTSTGAAVLALSQVREVLRQIALIVDQWRRTTHTIRHRHDTPVTLQAISEPGTSSEAVPPAAAE